MVIFCGSKSFRKFWIYFINISYFNRMRFVAVCSDRARNSYLKILKFEFLWMKNRKIFWITIWATIAKLLRLSRRRDKCEKKCWNVSYPIGRHQWTGNWSIFRASQPLLRALWLFPIGDEQYYRLADPDPDRNNGNALKFKKKFNKRT